jgi:hypothetical protein
MADARTSEARLLVTPKACDLLVTSGGGIVLLRRVLSAEVGGLSEPGALDALPGEVRISLRQLAANVRGEFRALTVTGSAEALRAVMPVLESEADADPWAPQADAAPAGPGLRCCERLAALAVSGLRPPMALAPVPIPRARSWLRRWRPRHLLAAAGGLAAAVLVVVGLVLYQRWNLAAVRSQWARLAPRAEAVRRIVAYAKSHAAWLADQPESLEVLRAVALALPERGAVWATRIEIEEQRQVTVSGKATSREDWLRTLEALRQTPGVRELRVSQARASGDGKSPMTFALRFTWHGPASGGRADGEATP